MKYADLIGKMTLPEKAGLCSGLDYWHTKPVERLGVPSVMLSDGPHGLRRHPGKVEGKNKRMPLPATCFPLACLSACSWDPALLREVGAALFHRARFACARRAVRRRLRPCPAAADAREKRAA